MDRIVWRLLMWMWTRRATKLYGGSSEHGEMFNTACFQWVVQQTTTQDFSEVTAAKWLLEAGWTQMSGGCHWK